MRRILVTGMSGTGKSSAHERLRLLGFRTVDTDEGGWTESSAAEDGYVWREQRIPADVLLSRIGARPTNPYGKTAAQRKLVLRHLAEVEPLLRRTCTHEIDATQPLADVVGQLAELGREFDQGC